jgi:hypothetical protein
MGWGGRGEVDASAARPALKLKADAVPCQGPHADAEWGGPLGHDEPRGVDLRSKPTRTGSDRGAAPIVLLMTLKHSRPSSRYTEFLRGLVSPHSQA